MAETQPPTACAGEELAVIMRDMDATYATWQAAGYGYDTPEDQAKEAVYERLRAWSEARA